MMSKVTLAPKERLMNLDFYNKWAVYFMDLLIKDFNLSVLDAAAIVGNAGHESGGFQSLQEKKPLVPGSKGGYGIMQWTGPRRREYEAYCAKHKLNPADMETNYKFLFVELKGPEGKVLPKVKAAKTLDEKVVVFMKGFLRPGIPHEDQRKVWAKRALKAWDERKYITEIKEDKKTDKVTPKRTLLDILVGVLNGILMALKAR